MTPAASSVLVEQRFLGSLLGAVERGDLPQFLTEVHQHTPGPLARWITDPAHRLVVEQVDDILADGGTPDAMTICGRLLDRAPAADSASNLQRTYQDAQLAAVALIEHATQVPEMYLSAARALRDAHDRRELLESLRWTAGELKSGEDLATIRDLLTEKLRDTTVRRDALQPITAQDLVGSHEHLRPALIEGLLRFGEVMNVVAAPKVGKSWLGLGLALSITTGAPWLQMETHQRRVLYIDNELHPETWAYRAHRVAAQMHAQDGLSNLHVISLRGQVRSLPDMERQIIDSATRLGVGMIILDALYRMLPAEASENDNAAMTALWNCLDRIASATGCALAVIHHSSKGAQGDKATTDVGAGAGSIARAADTHLVLRQHEHDGLVIVDAAVRSWPPLEPFVITRGEPGGQGVVWKVQGDADPALLKGRKTDRSSAPSITAESFLATFLPQRPASLEEIMESARGAGLALSRGRIKGMLEHAVTEGKAVCIVGRRGTSLYGREADPDAESTAVRIDAYLKDHPHAGVRETARAVQCNPATVSRHLAKLEAKS